MATTVDKLKSIKKETKTDVREWYEIGIESGLTVDEAKGMAMYRLDRRRQTGREYMHHIPFTKSKSQYAKPEIFDRLMNS